MKRKAKINKSNCPVILTKATGKECCCVCNKQAIASQSLIKIGADQYLHSQPDDCSPERSRERFVIDYYTKDELSGMLFGYDKNDSPVYNLSDSQRDLFVKFLLQQNTELRSTIESYLQDQAHNFIYFPYYADKSWADKTIEKCPLCCNEKFGDVEGFHRVTIDAKDSDYVLRARSVNDKDNELSVTEVICMVCDRTLGFVADLPNQEDGKCSEQVIHNLITGYINPNIKLIPADTQICYECGRSVAPGSGRFVNRIPNLDSYEERKRMGVPFPEGEYMCHECDIKIRR